MDIIKFFPDSYVPITKETRLNEINPIYVNLVNSDYYLKYTQCNKTG